MVERGGRGVDGEELVTEEERSGRGAGGSGDLPGGCDVGGGRGGGLCGAGVGVAEVADVFGFVDGCCGDFGDDADAESDGKLEREGEDTDGSELPGDGGDWRAFGGAWGDALEEAHGESVPKVEIMSMFLSKIMK